MMGGVIAEYEQIGTGSITWARDYVYGASGELVCCNYPQSGLSGGIMDFLGAWLCDSCTAGELTWDADSDGSVSMSDYYANAAGFNSQLLPEMVYTLTDHRGSVIAISDEYGDTDEIAYDAWGTPYTGQGVDLQGLSILWNGYYYDYETGNYYLRNRYYSPFERGFVTEDPHGVNPDGNWNNPFSPKDQLDDGAGLQVYAQHEPVNGRDDWGLMIEESDHFSSIHLHQ
jgi:RHS repeat-associated protein